MRHVVLAFTLLAGPAPAADFRVLDIGAPCAEVASQETSLGSREVPWGEIRGATVHAFEGNAFGSKLFFLYVCARDALLTGNYFFPVEELSVAAATYKALHKQMSATYGSPALDNSPIRLQPVIQNGGLEVVQPAVATP